MRLARSRVSRKAAEKVHTEKPRVFTEHSPNVAEALQKYVHAVTQPVVIQQRATGNEEWDGSRLEQ